MAELETVKKELKALKSTNTVIRALERTQLSHLKRIEMLKRLEQTPQVKDAIRREECMLAQLNISKYINDSRTTEERYIEAINSLEPIDKAIILDSYINGRAYWQIGQKIGFSEEGIRKRVKKILSTLAKRI
ncbi:MAG: hypothetical protein IJ309_03405 [Clostridia bacterium]|nr:hypothetical protein [Clostridia bacterium]